MGLILGAELGSGGELVGRGDMEPVHVGERTVLETLVALDDPVEAQGKIA